MLSGTVSNTLLEFRGSSGYKGLYERKSAESLSVNRHTLDDSRTSVSRMGLVMAMVPAAGLSFLLPGNCGASNQRINGALTKD
jgi:hypothetical protein